MLRDNLGINACIFEVSLEILNAYADKEFGIILIESFNNLDLLRFLRVLIAKPCAAGNGMSQKSLLHSLWIDVLGTSGSIP